VPTCTIHQPVPQLYHKQMHQPCTKPVQITCHNNLSKQPITTTCLINLINQIRSTHQDQSPRQLSTICTISPRCASTKHNTTTHNHHQDQYVLLIIYQDKYATSSINHVSTILLTSASNHVPSMYQSCINYSSTMTHQYVPTSSIYTSCMCQLINYLSQPCTQHVPNKPLHQTMCHNLCYTTSIVIAQPKIPHQFYHPNLICNPVTDLVYMITYLQTFLNFNNKRLAFSSNFTLVSHD
jgi:hypothetical protein